MACYCPGTHLDDKYFSKKQHKAAQEYHNSGNGQGKLKLFKFTKVLGNQVILSGVLVSGSSGPGSRVDRELCILLLGETQLSQYLSPH